MSGFERNKQGLRVLDGGSIVTRESEERTKDSVYHRYLELKKTNSPETRDVRLKFELAMFGVNGFWQKTRDLFKILSSEEITTSYVINLFDRNNNDLRNNPGEEFRISLDTVCGRGGFFEGYNMDDFASVLSTVTSYTEAQIKDLVGTDKLWEMLPQEAKDIFVEMSRANLISEIVHNTSFLSGDSDYDNFIRQINNDYPNWREETKTISH